MMIRLRPIGRVRNRRKSAGDDFWGSVVSQIVLVPPFDEHSLRGIEAFSHAEVVFHFHLADERKTATGARHPRNRTDWPEVGIFAQRGKDRPNHLGLSVVKILGREGNILFVEGLDAIDGTPVLDPGPSAQWPSAQWPSAQWPSAQRPSAQRPSAQWPSAKRSSAQWSSAQWPSAQWSSAQWPSAQWSSAQWPSA